jgi:AcrR family transcriptional regulator
MRLIEVATSLFVRDGYKATSLKAIADELGISPPAVYWHFKSKRELFIASMTALLDDFVTSVADQVTANEPIERLQQFVAAHVMWKLQRRDAAGAYTASLGMRDIVHSLPSGTQRVLISKQRAHLKLLRGILEDGVASGVFDVEDIRTTSFALITMCEYVVTWYDPDGEFDPEQLTELYVNLAVKMVTPR